MHSGPPIHFRAESPEALAKEMRELDHPSDGQDASSWTKQKKERRWLCRLLLALPAEELYPIDIYHDDAPDFILVSEASNHEIAVEVTEMVSGNSRPPDGLPKQFDSPTDQWRQEFEFAVARKTRVFGWSSVADECCLLIVISRKASSKIPEKDIRAQIEHFQEEYWNAEGHRFDCVYVDTCPKDAEGRVIFDIRRERIARYPTKDPWAKAER